MSDDKKHSQRRLYLHVSTHGSGENYIQRMLYENAAILGGKGIYYIESSFEIHNQTFSHHKAVALMLQTQKTSARKQDKEFVHNWLSTLDRAARKAKALFISFRPQQFSYAVHVLLAECAKYPHLANMRCHAILGLGEQRGILEYCRKILPQQLSTAEIFASVRRNYADYATVLAEMSHYIPQEHTHIIAGNFTHFPNAERFAEEKARIETTFAQICDVPLGEMILPPSQHLFSSVSIYFWRAALALSAKMPLFCSPSIPALFAALSYAERISQMPPDWLTPPEMRRDCLAFCNKNNETAAHVLGRESLFSECCTEEDVTWSEPSPTPRCFHELVAALPSEVRSRWRNYYQTLSPLLSDEERSVLSCLELPRTCSVNTTTKMPTLSVLTLAYNHAQYIGEAIESVLAQKTAFPVEHIIVDDGSTDGTQDIIAAYAARHTHIRYVSFTKRSWKGENVQVLFSLCRSTYAALCDGDDYFTDPYKLQKQVDYLESHPECSMCFHQVRVVYEDGSTRERLYPPLELMPRGVRPYYRLADLLRANFIQTNSVMYRWRFQEGIPDWFQCNLIPGDWYWHLLHAEKGKIGFLNNVMSVYRRHANSLYYSSENQLSSVPHRILHGLKELEAYNAINRHFEGRYERALIGFANNVLVDFLKYARTTGDDKFLHEAGKLYPEFMAHFLKDVQIVRRTPPMN